MPTYLRKNLNLERYLKKIKLPTLYLFMETMIKHCRLSQVIFLEKKTYEYLSKLLI